MRVALLLALAALFGSAASADMWWESAVVYQIYPRSFKDSNGDGKGDLKGITEKLPYIKDLGVDAIWLSPIYKSPMQDFGYDITDYTAISEDYGNMADFDALVAEAKRLGIRVVMDFVPNHTSPESDWFVKSVLREGKYTDYYIWANGTSDPNNSSIMLPPNNWVSLFRKSAWEYNKKREQYYLHQFAVGQPDINYRNADLRQEMMDVLRFWLRKGVSGFRIDAVNYLYEVDPAKHNGKYPNEPPISGAASSEDYESLDHVYTRDQDETYSVVYDWRAVLDEFSTTPQSESKLMVTEAYTSLEMMMRYYGNGTRTGSVPFNFVYLQRINSTSDANVLKTAINEWMTNMPSGKVANWVNGNHDQSRMATRYGEKRIDAMNMLALILPGITFTYQGEELGMTDDMIPWALTVDPQACNTDDPIDYWRHSRDPARSPFHWDASPNAGFTSGNTTWLPVASNYRTVNVAYESAQAKSHYHFYKDVVALKHTPAIKSGKLETHVVSRDVFVVTRMPPKARGVLGIINLSSMPYMVDLTQMTGVSEKLTVLATGVDCVVSKRDVLSRNNITLSGNCAMVLQSKGAGLRSIGSFTVYFVIYFLYANLV